MDPQQEAVDLPALSCNCSMEFRLNCKAFEIVDVLVLVSLFGDFTLCVIS